MCGVFCVFWGFVLVCFILWGCIVLYIYIYKKFVNNETFCSQCNRFSKISWVVDGALPGLLGHEGPWKLHVLSWRSTSYCRAPGLASAPMARWESPEAMVRGIPNCPELCCETPNHQHGLSFDILPGTRARAKESLLQYTEPGNYGIRNRGRCI